MRRVIGAFIAVVVLAASALADVHYVWSNSPSPAPPYTNWPSAAHDIQSAIDAASSNDTVLVTNGVYETGAQITPGYSLLNRVVMTNNILVKSVNGPAVTIIKGQGPFGNDTMRCIFVTKGIIDGFTLTNGFTLRNGDEFYDRSGGGAYASGGTLTNCLLSGNSAEYGGGAFLGTLNNCTLSSNSADTAGGAVLGGTLNNCRLIYNSSGYGGGAAEATLNNCTLSGNSAGGGGGTSGGTLNNCTLSGNSASFGGGIYGGALTNCIVYFNSASNDPNYFRGTLAYCCTTPDPGGTGNITNEPMFVATNAGNYRLLAGSPCINAGNNAYVQGDTDLDGNPRIQQGVVDMGAYEFYQSAGIPSTWQAQYELPTNGCMDYWDSDDDGLFNWEEYIAGTVPTDSNSVLKLVEIASDLAGSNAVIAWQSVTGKLYTVERSCSLLDTPPFTNIESDISGMAGTTIYTDRTSSAGSANYRVKVE